MLCSIASSLIVLVLLSIFPCRYVVSAEKVTSDSLPFEDSITGRSLQTAVVGKVDKLILYNAITDLPIFTLTEGMVVNTATLNMNNFSVIATTVNGTVGSVRFGYNGKSNVRTETNAPYALCGGTGTNINVCTFLVVGQHNLTVTTYEGKRANGTIGSVEKLSFRIANIPSTMSPTKAPTKVPTNAPTKVPTKTPTVRPTSIPVTSTPTGTPSKAPLVKVPTATKTPSRAPTMAPLAPVPTKTPTKAPTFAPTVPVSCNIPKFPSTWQSYAPEYPLGAPEAQAEKLGNDFVVFGGFSADFLDVTNQTFARDMSVSNSTWRRMDDVPSPTGITHAATAVIGTKMYMCGGYVGPQPGPHIADCYIYDHSKAPGTGQWSNFTMLPNNGSGGGGMIYDVFSNALFYSGGAQRPILGSREAHDQNHTWKFSFDNPAAGWVASTPIPYMANHQSHVTAYYQGRPRHFFVGGQMGENEKQGNVADIFEFIASNETWVRRSSMPFGRGHTTVSTRAYGCGFIMAGGSINGIPVTKLNRTNDIIFYNIPSDNWTSIGVIPVKGATPKVFVDDNDFLYYVDNRRTSRRKMTL